MLEYSMVPGRGAGDLDQELKPEAQERGESRQATLQTSRRAHSEDLPHHEAQVEACDVHEIALENVRSTAQVHAAHAAGLQAVRESALEQLASTPHQRLAALGAQSSAVRAPRCASY